MVKGKKGKKGKKRKKKEKKETRGKKEEKGRRKINRREANLLPRQIKALMTGKKSRNEI